MQGWEGWEDSLAKGSSAVTETFLERVVVTIWIEPRLTLFF